MNTIAQFTNNFKKYNQKRKEIEVQIKDSYANDMMEIIKAITTNTKMLSIYEKTDDDKIKKALLNTINSKQFVTLMRKALKDQTISPAADAHTTVANRVTENDQIHEETDTYNNDTNIVSDDNFNQNNNFNAVDDNNN